MFLERWIPSRGVIRAQQKARFHHSWVVKTEESNLLDYGAFVRFGASHNIVLQCRGGPWTPTQGSVAGSWGRQPCQRVHTLYRNSLKIQIF